MNFIVTRQTNVKQIHEIYVHFALSLPYSSYQQKMITLQYVHLPTLLHKHESKSMLGIYALITKG